MKIIGTISEFRKTGGNVLRPMGLVPTMGFLHEGHQALIRQSKKENKTSTVSIFVNPTQFGPTEGFGEYPRDMEADLKLLESEGIDLVFAPRVDEVYPSGFSTYVEVGELAKSLEGKHRPTHFRGVATVVCKLLNVCRPDRAYFGQKDAQQCAVIKRLNQDLALGVEVVIVPTVRDSDGLALSSRNIYLKQHEREAALFLSQGLFLARDLFKSGVRSVEVLINAASEVMESSPLISIDYIHLTDPDTLEGVHSLSGNALLSAAIRVGEVRLIDNLILTDK